MELNFEDDEEDEIENYFEDSYHYDGGCDFPLYESPCGDENRSSMP